ncbi:hypothetical protein N3Z16_09615 (plasmid) [Candidatus Megaera polyxenophila]|uniref:hypothetical protein n=1 Tax=Candidatus Megaera polyxenophila TaxID=988779 RepID=UPI00249E52F8|nr:hypothetical protein N3Z16_09615 [Candidatus Megaera polyxenophila]
MMLPHHGALDKLKLFHLEDGGFHHQRDYKSISLSQNNIVIMGNQTASVTAIETFLAIFVYKVLFCTNCLWIRSLHKRIKNIPLKTIKATFSAVTSVLIKPVRHTNNMTTLRNFKTRGFNGFLILFMFMLFFLFNHLKTKTE